MSSIREILRMETADFEYLLDNQYKIPQTITSYTHIYNGRFGGGGMILNPFGIINDGLMEFVYFGKSLPRWRAMYLFSLPGGKMFVDPDFTIFRCK